MPEAAPPAAAPSAAPSSTPAPAAAPAQGAQGGTPTAAPAAQQPAPGGSEKFMVKVNGKLRELTRDEMIREAQKGFAARENFEKGAQLTRKNQELLRALAEPDPDRQEQALRALGVDPDKIAERRLARRAQEAQMTPEQRRIAELEAEQARTQKAMKDREAQWQAEQDAAQEKQLWAQMEAEHTAEIDRALKAGDLKGFQPAEVLYHMADAAMMNLEYGIQLTPAELVVEAKHKISEAQAQLRERVLTKLDGEPLLEFLGPDAVAKVLRAAVTRFKGGAPIQPLAAPAPINGEQKQAEKPKWVRPGNLSTPFF